MNADYQQKWNKCLELIRDNVGVAKFNAWFSRVRAIHYEENGAAKTIVLSVPSQFIYELLEGKCMLQGIGTAYCDVMRRSLVQVFGPGIGIEYDVPVVKNDEQAKVRMDAPHQSGIINNKLGQSTRKGGATGVQTEYEDFESYLNPAYNFANYCVGESNKLAFTIADYIVSHPEKTEFNPFFLYGSVGVGKTHLIQAIGTRLKEINPDWRVRYVAMREFQHQYVAAMQQRKIPEFVRWYQSIDVLLLDDVQELAGKTGTGDALFPVLNELHLHNRKLIFTSDRAPRELDGIADRIIDRFKWGVVEELPKPDRELRRAILRAKSRRSGVQLSEKVIDIIADHVTGSVRELEGVVLGLLASAISGNTTITEELVLEKIEHSVKLPKKRSVNFDMIVESVAEAFNLNPDVIFSHSRVRDIADARQVIMYLCNKLTTLSSPTIGRKLNREHSTVLHGIRTVADRLSLDKELAKTVEQIQTSLQS